MKITDISAFLTISGMNLVSHPKTEQDINNVIKLDNKAIFFVGEIDEKNNLIQIIRKNGNQILLRRF